jgi:chemotaxis protein MotB
MRKRNAPGTKKGAPAWMNTYGDMVTLLLTFFVLLYSFSTVDAEKWQALVVSLSGGGSGVLEEIAVTKQNTLEAVNFDELHDQLEEFQELYENVSEYIENNNLSSSVVLSKTDSEIQLRFVDNVLFDSGSADLKNNAREILSKITLAIKTYKDSIEMIRIEGHTDNVQTNTPQFPTNWELSTARAVEVLRFLIETRQVDPDIISAVGYGEYHPIADNNVQAGRDRNRRVDFVIARTSK